MGVAACDVSELFLWARLPYMLAVTDSLSRHEVCVSSSAHAGI